MKNWRINFIFGLIFLAGLTLLGKLFFIQVLNQAFYRALAEGQQKYFLESQGKRGEIFAKDKNGNLYVLATNSFKNLCYLMPKQIQDKEKTAKILSEILTLNETAILEKVNQEEQGNLQLLKDKLSEEELKKLKEENLAGLHIFQQIARVYPQEKLSSQTLGFLGGEGKGQYGVEGFYEEILQGKAGWLTGETNPWGLSLGILESKIQEGSNLILTLDYNIQRKAEDLLQEAEKNLGIEAGQILVISPESGKIFALANFPSFDLNYYNEVKNQEIFLNGVLQRLFEPGSVFKPIVMTAGLEEQKITPQTTYDDTGFVQIGSDTINNYGEKVWGKQTMEQVLQKSINTGAVFVEKLVGQEKFLEYIEKFGFLEPTKVDLQAEVFSENKTLKAGRQINFATASFGQGVEITPLQLVRAFSAIANGGKLVRPYIVEKIIKADGETIETKPEIQKEIKISPQTLNQLTTMLVNVVEEGFGKGARILGYHIAGKTGTAQVAFSALGIDKPGYSEKTIQSFLGFFPAFDPQFLILVKLDNPKTKTAEYSAVPIFKELAKYIIDYWQIPPEYE